MLELKKIKNITFRENIAAAARTCYNKKLVYPEETISWYTSKNNTNKLILNLIKAEHNTTLEHYTINIAIENISRYFIWKLNSINNFYVSDQQSQRYVDMSNNSFIIPKNLKEEDKLKWENYYNFLVYSYKYLKEELQKELDVKKANEIARYVLPNGIKTNLIYTINFMTIIRLIAYARNCIKTPECEIKEEWENFAKQLEKILRNEINNIPEEIIINEIKKIRNEIKQILEMTIKNNINNEKLNDLSLKEKIFNKRLDFVVNYKIMNQRLLDEIIQIMEDKYSLLFEEMNNNFKNFQIKNIDIKNYPIIENTNINMNINIKYTNFDPLFQDETIYSNFTVKGILSISADSQNQRHRTTLKIRLPILKYFDKLSEKYYIPTILKKYNNLLNYYKNVMNQAYNFIEEMKNKYPEYIGYLLPNSQYIYVIDQENVFFFKHKTQKRLCFNSQEEIYNYTLKIVNELEKLYPGIIDKFQLKAPCQIRNENKIFPICPEGDRFCGIKVWKYDKLPFRNI